jgi:hypothetical protein
MSASQWSSAGAAARTSAWARSAQSSMNALPSASSHASMRRTSRPREAISLVRSATISPSSSIAKSSLPSQSGRSSTRQAWMPLRHGSTGASTHAPGAAPAGSGHGCRVKAPVPSRRRNL